MKVTLICEDWRKNGKSVYANKKSVFARCMAVNGERFPASIHIPKESENDFRDLIEEGYQPIFRLTIEQNKPKRKSKFDSPSLNNLVETASRRHLELSIEEMAEKENAEPNEN